LLSLPTLGKGQSFSRPVIVVFEDGVELEISDCAFVYEYGESYVPPRPPQGQLFYTYHPSTRRTTELLLGPHSKTEGGATSTVNERIIPSDELSVITFDWPSEHPALLKVTIKLTNGEIIKVDEDALKPRSLLSSADYVFNIRLSLIGKMRIDQTVKWFDKRLDYKATSKPSETIAEIRFQASQKQQ
jgi:hypothetical protein